METRVLRVMGQVERLSTGEFVELLMRLRKVIPLPAGTLTANHETLRALLHAYLLEFGEGYDVASFIDWCVVGVHWSEERFSLREFYEKRAAERKDS